MAKIILIVNLYTRVFGYAHFVINILKNYSDVHLTVGFSAVTRNADVRLVYIGLVFKNVINEN